MRTLKRSDKFGENGVQNDARNWSRITVNFIQVTGCWFSASNIDLGFKQKAAKRTNYNLD